MKKLRIIALLLAIIMAVGIMAACAQDEEIPEPVDTPAPADDTATTPGANVTAPEAQAATLTVVVASFPQSLDPHNQLDMYSAMIGTQIFDTLFVLDPETMVVRPNLVVHYSRPDMQTLAITLRDDVRFHNGDSLTARDVSFSLNRAINSPHVGFIVDMIEEIYVHSDLDITIRTSEPFAPIINHLTHFGTSIISESAYHVAGGNPDLHPVGTGAFMYVERVDYERVEMRRFDNFWGQLPDFTHIDWRIIPNAANRLAEVEDGRADIAFEVAPGDIGRADASPNVVLHRVPGLGVHYLGLNLQHDLFNDVRVRQAIAYAIDLNEITITAYGDASRPARGSLADAVWGAHNVAQIPFNLQRARELLAETDFPAGFSTTLWYDFSNAQHSLVAQTIQAQLRNVGIEMAIQSFDREEYLERLRQGEHQMFLMFWNTVTGDADLALYETQSTWGWGGGNLAFSGTAEIDSLLRQSRQIEDAAQRLEVYRQVQYLVRDHAARIYFQQSVELHASSPNVSGFVVSPTGLHDLSTVTVDG